MCIYLYVYTCMYVVGIYKVKVTQLCLTLCDPRPHFHVLCPWNSPGKNTGVGFHFLFQGIFLTQGLNLGLQHCMWILYQPPEKPCGYIYFYIKIRLTFAQHRFELYRSTYTYIFFWSVNIIVPHDPRLTESMDMEGRLLIICGFSTKQRVGDPNTCAKFKDRVCVCVCVI